MKILKNPAARQLVLNSWLLSDRSAHSHKWPLMYVPHTVVTFNNVLAADTRIYTSMCQILIVKNYLLERHVNIPDRLTSDPAIPGPGNVCVPEISLPACCCNRSALCQVNGKGLGGAGGTTLYRYRKIS